MVSELWPFRKLIRKRIRLEKTIGVPTFSVYYHHHNVYHDTEHTNYNSEHDDAEHTNYNAEHDDAEHTNDNAEHTHHLSHQHLHSHKLNNIKCHRAHLLLQTLLQSG